MTPRFLNRAAALVAKLLFAIGLCLLSIEVGARIVGWGQVMEFVQHDEWGYLMRPSQSVASYGHPVRINSSGLRGPEIRQPKLPSGSRILFIGDSVTYGGGRIEEQELFCRIVESSLTTDGQKTEAVNLSAPGWSPQNWVKYVQRNGLNDADLVILVLPEADLTRPFSTIDVHGFREHAPPLRLQSMLTKVSAIVAQQSAASVSPSLSQVEHAVQSNVQAVSELVRICSAENTGFLTVLVPSAATGSEEFWPRFEAAIPDVLDLRHRLDDATLFIDGAHLNAQGHAVVAEEILARLIAAR